MDETYENYPHSHVRTTTPRNLNCLAIHDRIGEQLRTMYRDLEAEPLPDRLLDLLKQLDEAWSGEAS